MAIIHETINLTYNYYNYNIMIFIMVNCDILINYMLYTIYNKYIIKFK